MATSMGLGAVLGRNDIILKRSNRWMLSIDGVAGNSVNLLPPLRGQRPGLTFREIEIEHTTETIFVPTKAQWKPIKITLYDVASNLKNNLVFDWITKFYNAQNATYKFISNDNTSNFKKNIVISLFSGAGCALESWSLDGAWIKDMDFSPQDMANAEICTIEMEIRYDRAYINNNAAIDPGTGRC